MSDDPIENTSLQKILASLLENATERGYYYLMTSRQEMARKIASKPDDYKICEGCDSIVVVNSQLCPNCHAYRFNECEADVILHAERLGARDKMSVTAEDLH